MREQCEECLGYFDESEIKQPMICKGCLDKAASYDITKRDKDYLLKEIDELIEKADGPYALPYFIARLKAASNYCKPVERARR